MLLNEEKNKIKEYVNAYKPDEKSYDIAKVLINNNADYYSILSGIYLTDFRKNPELIKELNLPKTSINLLNSIIKIENIKLVNEEISTENIKNLLISIANDIRVILIKLADILVDAENIDKFSKSEADNLHLLIKELYVPISARLGLSSIKSELQDLNVKYLYPREYQKIENELEKLLKNRDIEVEKNIKKLQDLLKKLNIDGKVYGRVKHISSIFNKIKDKNYNISQIYDLLAVRIIVNTESECYEVLSYINSMFEPIDGRFKDYIARPKPNGYKSIHTTVITDNNDPLEIQIRTTKMHEFNEYGVAAHFLYKEKKTKTDELDQKLTWVRKMLENSNLTSSADYLDELKTDLYANEIFVQTPLGKVISLKEESTPIDFAYSIHSQIGNQCVGSKVNGKLVPLSTKLKNGDVVEIITSPNGHPSRDWLKLVNTSIAKNRLKAYFKKQNKEENIRRGKEILEDTCKAKHIELKDLLVDEWLNELYIKWTLKNLDDLYASVGFGSLTSTQVVNKLFNKYKEQQKLQEDITKKIIKKSNSSKDVTFDNNLDNLMVRFAKCCSPVPGDEIIGFVSQGRGITIHAKDCGNVKNFDKNRIVNAYFNDQINKKFDAHINILANKSNTIIVNVTKLLSEEKVDISGVNVYNLEKNQQLLSLYVSVKDTNELNSIINKLSSLKDVLEVKRAKGE